MIVTSRSKPTELLPAVDDRVFKDVSASLKAIKTTGEQCIVNDTAWFSLKGDRAKRCVMNQAEYFSKQFLAALHKVQGWEKEKTIEGQRIDAFIRIAAAGSTFVLTNENFRQFIIGYWSDHPDMEIADISRLYGMYCKRNIYDIPPNLPARFRHLFTRGVPDERIEVRVGLEFETGNISSAFRAFSKLNTLYSLGCIDLGVFITTNRAAAIRIWPASNRNVSYEELENRKYKSNIQFPLWEFVFEPDGYDREAPYLKADGTVYAPVATNQIDAYGGNRYRVFRKSRENTEELLLPIGL